MSRTDMIIYTADFCMENHCHIGMNRITFPTSYRAGGDHRRFRDFQPSAMTSLQGQTRSSPGSRVPFQDTDSVVQPLLTTPHHKYRPVLF